jgi:parallel beta-helix repeat protein
MVELDMAYITETCKILVGLNMKKVVLLAFVLALLSTTFVVMFIRPAAAQGTIYIRASGLVEGTDKISSADNITYTFTGNIGDSIVVQRSNIIIDGNGYTVQGPGTGPPTLRGIRLTTMNNITIKDANIKGFTYGIELDFSSSNNSISGNNITNNGAGIYLENSLGNSVSGNNITNSQFGIDLADSSSNLISGNNITSSLYGISVSFSSSNNNISVNTITNNGYGVDLSGSSNNSISLNTITNNGNGGVRLGGSSDNTIEGNSIAYSGDKGIRLYSSSNNNTISGNSITANNGGGIYLDDSSSNVISGNNIGDSPNEHIALLYSSNNNIISGNSLTNSTADVGIYLYGCSLNSFFGNNITSNADSGIRIDSSSDSTVSENNISENLNGIYLFYSSNITISKNDITANNVTGIVIDLSDNNTVNGNNIMTNKEYGVDFNSASNKFFHNNFINNTVQVRVPNYNNTWDNGYPSGGNFWSDYLTRYPDATEIDHTGIGDTAYEINANNIDHYPFMIPYETTPPTMTILSPENKTYAVNASIPLTFTVDEFANWTGYSLNGQANVTITGNTTLPMLSDGWHHVTVYANDTFGNMGSATVYFTIDTIKPDITNVAQDPPTNILPHTAVKINATVTDVTSGIKQVTLNYTTGDGTWITVEMTNLDEDIWNATIPAFPYGTNVTYVIIAEDNAGNTITTEQIYGYKYEYPVVPEFPLATVLFALMMTTLLAATVFKRKTSWHRPA